MLIHSSHMPLVWHILSAAYSKVCGGGCVDQCIPSGSVWRAVLHTSTSNGQDSPYMPPEAGAR